MDLRQGWNRLLAHWGASLLAVTILALGIGGTIEIYSLGRAMLEPPVRLPQAQRLSILYQAQPHNYWPAVSPANYKDLQRQSRRIAGLAAFKMPEAIVRFPERAPQQVYGLRISRHFFPVLGAGISYGRPFLASEYQPGPARAIILTYAYWVKRLHREPGLNGQTVQVNGHAATIVGIASPRMDFPLKEGIILPLALTPAQWQERNRGNFSIHVLARRRAGITLDAERAGLQAIASRLAALHPKTDSRLRIALLPPAEFVNGNLTPVFINVLMAGSLMLLLLVCANVANLQLASSLQRGRELALRAALGAGRGRLLRAGLTDALLLGLVGGAGGILVGDWFCTMMRNSMPARLADQILGWRRIGLNLPVLAFGLGLAIASGLLAGLAPAWFMARPNLMEVLKAGGRNIAGGKHRLRKGLIIGQMTLAFTLLLGAALAAWGFHQLVDKTASYRADKRLTFQLRLPIKTYATPAERLRFITQLYPRLWALPGVKSAAMMLSLPYANGDSPTRYMGVTDARRRAARQKAFTVLAQPISSNALRVMRLQLISGRNFNAGDGAGSPLVAIASHNLVQNLWPGQNPLGKTLLEPGPNHSFAAVRIVGVAPALRYNLFNSQPDQVLYFPYSQAPRSDLIAANQLSVFTFVLRTRVPPLTLAHAVRRTVAGLDPALAVSNLKSLQRFFQVASTPLRLIDRKMITLGVMALLIAAVGLFGVITAFMVERRREMGIRMVLGAEGKTVGRLAFIQGLRLTLWGMGISLPLGWLINKFLATLIYGIAPLEWPLMLLVALLLALATLAACYFPARAVARYDPAEILCSE